MSIRFSTFLSSVILGGAAGGDPLLCPTVPEAQAAGPHWCSGLVGGGQLLEVFAGFATGKLTGATKPHGAQTPQ